MAERTHAHFGAHNGCRRLAAAARRNAHTHSHIRTHTPRPPHRTDLECALALVRECVRENTMRPTTGENRFAIHTTRKHTTQLGWPFPHRSSKQQQHYIVVSPPETGEGCPNIARVRVHKHIHWLRERVPVAVSHKFAQPRNNNTHTHNTIYIIPYTHTLHRTHTHTHSRSFVLHLKKTLT